MRRGTHVCSSKHALSVLMIAAGVAAIWAPVIAGITVTAIVGWLLIFSGALHVAFAWQAGRAGAVLWEILLGIVYGAIGLYLLASPVAGLASLAIAIYLVVEGVLELVLSLQLRPVPGSGWLLADALDGGNSNSCVAARRARRRRAQCVIAYSTMLMPTAYASGEKR